MILPLAATLAATALTATAQKHDRRGDRRPPPPPAVVAVIDADHDGTISEEELSGAAEALAKLDENGDGALTPDELRLPPPPKAPKGDGEDEGEGGGQGRPPRPHLPPVIAALDTDKDGTISAAELEAAPESLKALDKDGDGELSPEELRPQGMPPHGGGPRGGGRPQGPPPGAGEREAE